MIELEALNSALTWLGHSRSNVEISMRSCKWLRIILKYTVKTDFFYFCDLRESLIKKTKAAIRINVMKIRIAILAPICGHLEHL